LLEVQQELMLPKQSQVRIAIGRGGVVAQRIADQAVVVLEKMLGKRVLLSLRFRHG
jgi:GTPase Era involved in 16S rRNA processing